MFLRRYHRTKDGKTHTYYALVESVRTESGPRQHTVAYLGELNHDQERRWQRTVLFHNRQGEDRQLRLFPDAQTVTLPDDPDVVQVRLDSVGWTNPRSFGAVWLGLWLWKFLRLDEIVDRHIPQRNETKRSGLPTSWRSRSSTVFAVPAVSSHWRSIGINPRVWKTCLASPTAP